MGGQEKELMETVTAPKEVVKEEKLVAFEMPTEEITGGSHPRVQINRDIYEPGQTYMVTPARKAGIEERLKAHAKACIRLTQGRKVTNVNGASTDQRVR
jgi:hypothetical protein